MPYMGVRVCIGFVCNERRLDVSLVLDVSCGLPSASECDTMRTAMITLVESLNDAYTNIEVVIHDSDSCGTVYEFVDVINSTTRTLNVSLSDRYHSIYAAIQNMNCSDIYNDIDIC